MRKIFFTNSLVSLIIFIMLTGCTTTTTSVAPNGVSTTTTTTRLIDPQVLANAKIAVAEAQTIIKLINQYKPAAISPADNANITIALNSAQALVGTLSNNTTALEGAATIQKIESAINIILTAAGPVLSVVAGVDPKLEPAVVAYSIIMPLVPGFETWVNSILGIPPTPTTSTP